MLKFVDYQIVFQEIPDEVTLAINISNCPCHCEGCHSSYLAEDIGETLTTDKLRELINNNKGISCVAFMGGDAHPNLIHLFAMYIKGEYPHLKVGWYSGKNEVYEPNMLEYRKYFDYIKIGSYLKDKGPLNNPNTNQRLYKIDHDFYHNFIDITYKFWN